MSTITGHTNSGNCLLKDGEIELLADELARTAIPGYTNCQACEEPSKGDLCKYCRLGAYENNHDPVEIESDDFNGHLLAVWRVSGEAIAEREDEEYRQRMNGVADVPEVGA